MRLLAELQVHDVGLREVEDDREHGPRQGARTRRAQRAAVGEVVGPHARRRQRDHRDEAPDAHDPRAEDGGWSLSRRAYGSHLPTLPPRLSQDSTPGRAEPCVPHHLLLLHVFPTTCCPTRCCRTTWCRSRYCRTRCSGPVAGPGVARPGVPGPGAAAPGTARPGAATPGAAVPDAPRPGRLRKLRGRHLRCVELLAEDVHLTNERHAPSVRCSVPRESSSEPVPVARRSCSIASGRCTFAREHRRHIDHALSLLDRGVAAEGARVAQQELLQLVGGDRRDAAGSTSAASPDMNAAASLVPLPRNSVSLTARRCDTLVDEGARDPQADDVRAGRDDIDVPSVAPGRGERSDRVVARPRGAHRIGRADGEDLGVEGRVGQRPVLKT